MKAFLTRTLLRFSRWLRIADALQRARVARDKGRIREAAEAYAVALDLAPGSTNIRVQLANMLKDSGQYGPAEAIYLVALEAKPRNADTHLQLGHLRKLTGRWALAMDSYRRALALKPELTAAFRELARAGDPFAQGEEFEANRRHGATEALLAIRSRLDEITGQIALIRERLPAALAAAAYPIEAYAEFRRVFDLPAPGSLADDLSIAVVLLADNEPLAELHAQLSSLLAQTHANWRLAVVAAEEERRRLVERLAAAEPRVSLWSAIAEENDAQAERRVAIGLECDWVLLPAPGSLAHRHLLAWIASVALRTRCAAVVVDGEVGEAEGHLLPELTHTFDVDTILEANVWGESLALRSAVLRELPPPLAQTISETRSDLLLQLRGVHRVAHIPLPLIRTPLHRWRTPERHRAAHHRAVVRYLGDRPGVTVQPSPDSEATLRVHPGPRDAGTPLSIVIPTKNNVDDVTAFVRSLADLAARPDRLEILILNNGDPSSTTAILAGAGAAKRQLRVLELGEPFNWSRFSNFGASNTTAPLLLFANDDMRMISPHWDEVLRGLLERPDAGAVGARLLYPDRTIQHAGVLFDWHGSTIHDGLHRPEEDDGPALRWRTTRAASAVTGAFLATPRSVFQAAGGFDETNLAVSYSDVDYCLELRALGRKVLWTPHITAFHFESKTRGLDHLDPAKAARDAAEYAVLRRKWGSTLDTDPSLNPLWVQATLPHRLLGFPSAERLWRYIETGAGENPWGLCLDSLRAPAHSPEAAARWEPLDR